MAHILVVDDEEILRDVLSAMLASMGHTSDVAENGQVGYRCVEAREYDLIITDIHMPEMSGIEFLRKIEPFVESCTPCLIVTALFHEPSVAVKAVRLACDFISKPFEMKTIQHAVNRALELREAWKFRHDYEERLEQELRRKESELLVTYDGVLIGFAAMLEGKDDQATAQHCERVRDYCTIIARSMGVEDRIDYRNLQLGAMLHDIGKYRVPDAILRKPGPLTEEEWTEMRRHPEYGSDFVKEIPFLARAAEVILNHHERWDGKGYPQGLEGEEIPLEARIFFVADAFDAICENRCYRPARSPDEALEELRRNAGTQFDPKVVEAFERVYDRLVAWQPRIREAAAAGGSAHRRVEHGVTVRDLAKALRHEVAEETRLAVSR